MATANPTKRSSSEVSIARPSEAPASPAVQVAAPTRREFLNYIWVASFVMLFGQFTAIGLWFGFPRFKAGEFGGEFTLDPAELPAKGSPPESFPSGRFWVSNTDRGLLAMFAVCTHLGCLPKWVPTNTRFECPCHGSKYQSDGSWIEGPAPRGLDRFPVTITYSDGSTVQTDSTGAPLPLNPGQEIVDISIDTGAKIRGPAHGVTL